MNDKITETMKKLVFAENGEQGGEARAPQEGVDMAIKEGQGDHLLMELCCIRTVLVDRAQSCKITTEN